MPKAIAKWTGGGAEWCVANNIMLTFNLIWHNAGACIFYYPYTLLWCLYNFLIINHVSTVTYKYTDNDRYYIFMGISAALRKVSSFLSFISNCALIVSYRSYSNGNNLYKNFYVQVRSDQNILYFIDLQEFQFTNIN